MNPQQIVDLLLSLLPAVASVAPAVYAALFGSASVESMTTRAREALAKAGSTRTAMAALFEPHPAMVAVVQKSPQVTAHLSDRLRALSVSTSLTAEDRDALAKSAALIASAVAHSEALAPAPPGTWGVKGGEALSVSNGSAGLGESGEGD